MNRKRPKRLTYIKLFETLYDIDQSLEGMVSYYKEWFAQFYEDFKEVNPALMEMTRPLDGWRFKMESIHVNPLGFKHTGEEGNELMRLTWLRRTGEGMKNWASVKESNLRFVFEIECIPFYNDTDSILCKASTTVMKKDDPGDDELDTVETEMVTGLSQKLSGLLRDEFETRLAEILTQCFFDMLKKILIGMIKARYIDSMEDVRFFLGDDLSWYPGGISALERMVKTGGIRARMF